ALHVAARLLDGLPSRLGLGAGALRLDAGRLRLRGRLLGPPAGAARPAVLPGALHAAPGGRLGVHAPLRRPQRLLDDGPVRRPGAAPFLLRRLLHGTPPEARLPALGRLPPDAPQL